MSDPTLPACEPNPTTTLLEEPGVLVAKRHHLLVRWSHWLNVPILLGLILSGISIYWASPVYQHKVQRPPASSILLCSGRRVPFGRYGVGDSQAHAVSLAGCDFRRV